MQSQFGVLANALSPIGIAAVSADGFSQAAADGLLSSSDVVVVDDFGRPVVCVISASTATAKKTAPIINFIVESMAAQLHDAIARNDVECIKSLLNKNDSDDNDNHDDHAIALVNSVHGDGFDSRTALSRAAEIGAIDIVRLLLDRGAVASATDVNGGTAIWFASERGHASVVALLKERGALVNDNAEDSGDYDHAGLDFD